MDDAERLLASSPSASRGMLLELVRLQAARRRPVDLLAQYERDGFVVPSALDQRLIHTLDGLALEAAQEFDAVQLSPVAPLGSNSVVAPTSQDRTLSTTRGSEVVSDPTNILALEAARRLSVDPTQRVALCTAHQTLRTQPMNEDGAYSRHFRLFALAEAGGGLADDGFEVGAIARQLSVYDRLFDACSATFGTPFPERTAIVRIQPRRRVLADRVLAELAGALPHVAIVTEDLESSYYDGLRVGFGATTRSGEFCEIADLGIFDWVAQLTTNKRMRFVASGFGIQLVPLLF